MTRSKSYHHGNLKEALIQAGLEILEEKGLTGLTLRSCAIKAGASHTAPQNHFGNLAGLQTAIAARGYDRMYDRMMREVDADAPLDALRHAALAGYVGFAQDEPGLFELMFSRHRTKSDDPDLLNSARRCFAVLAKCSAGLDWSKSDAPNAALRAQILHWCIVQGFAQLKIAGKLDKGAMKDVEIFDIFPDFTYGGDDL